MIRSEVGDPRGILHADPDARGVEHLRLAPAPALTPFIAHFWIIRWDRQGLPPLRPETLPHPSVHMVIEGRRRAEILGVMTGKFSRTLRAQGRVFGIKFRPAAFRPFLGAPLARITNRALPIADRFGAAGLAFARAVRAEPDARACVRLAEAFLAERLPPRDRTLEMLRDLVERTAVDRELVRVEQLTALAGLPLRQLQRAFRSYVGVTPKWVIQRYRLHEAVEQLAAGGVNLAALAQQLGYFDQAHFIRDFKKIIGRPPGEYAKE